MSSAKGSRQVGEPHVTRERFGLFTVVLLIFTLVPLSCLTEPVYAQGSIARGLPAPVNPAYEKYMAAKNSGTLAEIQNTKDGRFLGHIPPRFIVPAQTGLSKAGAKSASIPSKYDLREASTAHPVHPIGVTPVRKQGSCGSCWVFAAMASLESHLKLRGVTADLSEGDLNENHGWAPPPY